MLQSNFQKSYLDYTANVSPSAMALSLESLEAIWTVLEERQPRRILEYGSGISTLLLAGYATAVGAEFQSFDSDAEWASRTNQFLRDHGVSDLAVVRHAAVVDQLAPADFVVWDFDSNPKRVVLMADAFVNVCAGGVMYVDDMHNGEIASACNALGSEFVGEAPKDAFGRYGVFVQKM